MTGPELDALAEAAWKVEGVLGSRMTGGGFGGCTVSLVREEAIPTFIEQVGKAYIEKTGLKADFYIAEIGDGATSSVMACSTCSKSACESSARFLIGRTALIC